MRFFIFLGFVTLLLLTFSTPTFAGGVPTFKTTNSNTNLVNALSPIEPIATQKPIEPSNSSKKGRFWKKFKPNKLHKKSSTAEISDGWYTFISYQASGFAYAFVGMSFASVLYLVLLGFSVPSLALLYIGLALLGIIFAIPLFMYASSLTDGDWDRRFIWGYISGIMSLLYWGGLVVYLIGLLAPLGVLFPIILIGIIALFFGPLILVFNIIDHKQEKKYEKEKAEKALNPAPKE